MSWILRKSEFVPILIKNQIKTHQKQKINTILVNRIILRHLKVYYEANITILNIIVSVFSIGVQLNIEDFLYDHNLTNF